MDNDVDAVVLACRGTLASWSLAVEAVAYEQARVNAESPLDRGAALRLRVEGLSMAADAPRRSRQASIGWPPSGAGGGA